MSFMSYSASGFIACILADYIRRLGYPARAHHARNYQIVLPPILLWAGLGEMSRIGDCVLHPFMGPRFKAAVVTTTSLSYRTNPSISGCRISAPNARSARESAPRAPSPTGAR